MNKYTIRRTVAIAIVASVIATGCAVVSKVAASTTPAVSTVSIVATNGSTLWEMCAQVNPNSDPRECIHVANKSNDIQGAIDAGRSYDIPVIKK